jgi:hypothetical protein
MDSGYSYVVKQYHLFLKKKIIEMGDLPSNHFATSDKSQQEHHHEFYQGSGLLKPMLQTAQSYL